MKFGVADYGMQVWYGGFYDYEERLASVRKIGFDGLERLHPGTAEDALTKAARLRKLDMGFATCNASTPELAIKWTSALGGEYVWEEVSATDYTSYVRQINEMTRVCKNYGIKVVIHNHLGLMIETQEQIDNVMRDCPDVNLLFDVGHLAVAGGDVRYICEKYYERIAAYHLKGWQTSMVPNSDKWYERGHFCGLGQGDFFVDNEYVFKNAVKNNFDGWVFIEHDTHKQDPLVDLEESYKILMKWREEVWNQLN